MVSQYCAVADCWELYGGTSSKHRFPNPNKNKYLFDKWVAICANKKLQDYTPERIYNNCRVCSKHFMFSDFGRNNVLNKGVWPTIDVPITDISGTEIVSMTTFQPESSLCEPTSITSLQSDATTPVETIPSLSFAGVDTMQSSSFELGLDNRFEIVEESSLDSAPRNIFESILELEHIAEDTSVQSDANHIPMETIPSSSFGGVNTVQRGNFKFVRGTKNEIVEGTNLESGTLEQEHTAEGDQMQLTSEEEEMQSVNNTNLGTVCRTCADISDCLYPINSIIPNSPKTLKDMITLLVPEMETTFEDNDVLCTTCRKTLTHCAWFIDKYLRVEADRKVPIGENDRTVSKEMTCFSDENLDMNDLSADDQLDNNTCTLNGYLESNIDNVELLEISENNPEIDKVISRIDLVDEEKRPIFQHNLLISTKQLPSEELHKFTSILPSNDVKTYDFSYDLENTEKKRIILVGSTFKCYECGLYFSTKGSYEFHLRVHKRNERKLRKNLGTRRVEKQKQSQLRASLQCKTCSEQCSSKEELKCHVELHPPFVCEKCGKGFASKKLKALHEMVHNDPNSFICEVCGKAYKSRPQLYAHGKSHENTSHLCSKCPKFFNTARQLKIHLKFTHNVGSRTWTCEICGKMFNNPGVFKLHYSQIHLRDGPKKCDICGQGFARSDYLKRHKRSHSSHTIESFGDTQKRVRKQRLRPGPYQCQICMRILKTVETFKIHIRSHVTSTRFNCRYCNLNFKHKYQRNRHEKVHREGEISLKYRCGTCWKRFGSQEELDQHSVIHNNLKYKCDDCEECFARKHLLDDHIASTHVDCGEAEKEMRTLLSTALEAIYT